MADVGAGIRGGGPEKTAGASVLVSRCGGVGGAAALELAAAGVGRLILAHAGDLTPADLNRQLLMSRAGVGHSRVEQAARRIRDFNPDVEVVPVGENLSEANAARLVGMADLVVDGAPLFAERYLMNRECVRRGNPLSNAPCTRWRST